MVDEQNYDFGVPEEQNGNNNNESTYNASNGMDSKTQANNTTTLGDPNIPKDNAPIVVLVGPPQSGKSMVLKCLADYLRNVETNCTVEANRNLFDSPEYQANCDTFEALIGDTNKKMPNTINFLMVDLVDRRGETVAHFLEAPGEDYFSLKDPDQEPKRAFPGYMDSIARIDDRHMRKVVYVIILDLDSDTPFRRSTNKLKEKYTKKMVRLHQKYVIKHPAEVILLYNKADIPHDMKWANDAGVHNRTALLNDARGEYKDLFFTEKFLFWDISAVQFVPFCTGLYSGDQYNSPSSSYPRSLWKAIKKSW